MFNELFVCCSWSLCGISAQWRHVVLFICSHAPASELFDNRMDYSGFRINHFLCWTGSSKRYDMGFAQWTGSVWHIRLVSQQARYEFEPILNHLFRAEPILNISWTMIERWLNQSYHLATVRLWFLLIRSPTVLLWFKYVCMHPLPFWISRIDPESKMQKCRDLYALLDEVQRLTTNNLYRPWSREIMYLVSSICLSVNQPSNREKSNNPDYQSVCL